MRAALHVARFKHISLSRCIHLFLLLNSAFLVTEAASPQKRRKSDALDGREDPKVLKFAKLTENATTPSRGSNRAAGFDLYSDLTLLLLKKGDRIAQLDALLWSHMCGVSTAGVVDEDYRGNLGVVLFNFNNEPFEVKKGDRIAQLICERICYPELQELQTLDETERGAGGFGSTGTN
uniref:Deoxyuridine 5'-triphosphate nucleotidohydrolase n=1 Tax=Sinocyclocheilus grahami TaxID=75366 RepID=A0A672SAD8_SINGR